MNINDNKLISVLNYNENPVAIKTNVREYLCPPADGENPSIIHLTFSEIQSLNSATNAFKIGILRFEKEEEEEVYDAIRLLDWKDILTNDEIRDIILNPTLDGLEKLINITNVSLFERVRGIFCSMKNANIYDISTRVEKIIDARYKELCNKQIKTGIVFNAKDTVTSVPSDDVNALKSQNEAMQNQIAQMQKMMEQMMALQQVKADTTQSETVKEVKEEILSVETNKKKSGRPKTVK